MRDGIILLTIFQLLFISIRTGLARDSPRSNANALRGFSRLSRVSRVTSRASNKEAGRTSFRTGGDRASVPTRRGSWRNARRSLRAGVRCFLGERNRGVSLEWRSCPNIIFQEGLALGEPSDSEGYERSGLEAEQGAEVAD